jgi:2-keto-4-pentenoate hydratase
MRIRRARVAPLRDVLDPVDADGAYAVQAINTRYWQGQGRRIARPQGRPHRTRGPGAAGRRSADFGVLFDDMRIADGERLDPAPHLAAQGGGRDRDRAGRRPPRSEHDRGHGRPGRRDGHAAIEIVDSRIADWKITFADTVATMLLRLLRAGRGRRPLDGSTSIPAGW